MGDLQERRDYGGKKAKRPTKIKQKIALSRQSPRLRTLSISSPIRDRIRRSVNIPTKKSLTLWNNSISKA